MSFAGPAASPRSRLSLRRPPARLVAMMGLTMARRAGALRASRWPMAAPPLRAFPAGTKAGRPGGDILADLDGGRDQPGAQAGGIVNEQLRTRVPADDRVLHPASRGRDERSAGRPSRTSWGSGAGARRGSRTCSSTQRQMSALDQGQMTASPRGRPPHLRHASPRRRRPPLPRPPGRTSAAGPPDRRQKPISTPGTVMHE